MKSCGIEKRRRLPTELSTTALAYAAEQMRLLGNTLVQSMRDPADTGPREFAAYVASEPIKVASDVLDISQPAMLARIASFIQGIEIEFGRGAINREREGPEQNHWCQRLYLAQEVSSNPGVRVPRESAKLRQKSGGAVASAPRITGREPHASHERRPLIATIHVPCSPWASGSSAAASWQRRFGSPTRAIGKH